MEKKVFDKDNNLASHAKFAYSGWNLIAELDGATDAVQTSYTWGEDIGGSLEGVGGIGGLISVTDSSGTYFPAYDGNGNIIAYFDSSGAKVASYEYDPFGKLISKSGALADKFKFRFSTKYYDSETGLYYFGYRYYNPETRRWLSRDPIDDLGFKVSTGIKSKNKKSEPLYVFVKNNPLNIYDYLGLKEYNPPPKEDSIDVQRDVDTIPIQYENNLIGQIKIKYVFIDSDYYETLSQPDYISIYDEIISSVKGGQVPPFNVARTREPSYMGTGFLAVFESNKGFSDSSKIGWKQNKEGMIYGWREDYNWNQWLKAVDFPGKNPNFYVTLKESKSFQLFLYIKDSNNNDCILHQIDWSYVIDPTSMGQDKVTGKVQIKITY